jgi:hypothetical protein
MWPILLAFLLFTVRNLFLSSLPIPLLLAYSSPPCLFLSSLPIPLLLAYSSPPCRYAIPLHFSHDLSKWPSPVSSSTIFENSPRICDRLSEASNIQHHKTLCSKCSVLPVSSLNWRPICWWKEPSSCRMPFFGLIFQVKLFCLLQFESPNSHVLKRTQSSSYDCISRLWDVSTLHVEYVHNLLTNMYCGTTK